MAVTDWKALGAASINNSLGVRPWNVWTQATLAAEDGSFSFSANGNLGQQTWYGVSASFDFAEIPSDATITGVEVRALCTTANGGRTNFCCDARLTLNAGATMVGNNLADTRPFHLSAPLDMIVGGSDNMWGLTLTRADVVNSGFGVGLRFERDSLSGTATRVAIVQMRVYYTSSSGGGGGGYSVGAITGVNYGLWASSGSATYNVLERRRNDVPIAGSGGDRYTLKLGDAGGQLTAIVRATEGGQSTAIETSAVAVTPS